MSVLIKEGKILKGIATDEDMISLIAQGKNPAKVKINQIMSRKIAIIGPNSDMYDALVKMRDLDLRRLPVLDKGNLVGLITIKDILKIQPDLFDNITENISLREEERKIRTENTCENCGNSAQKLHNVVGMMLCKMCASKFS